MLIRRKNKKPKYQLPTEDEFLRYTPKREDYEWKINTEGFVEIIIPKFKGNLGKSLCKIVRKDDNFIAKMDKIGTIVWKNCDGKKTVKHILEILQKKYPDDEDINQRLYLFLQQMNSLNYITLYKEA